MEFLLFNKWSTKDIKVDDPGLKKYLNIEPIIVPKSSGRQAKFRFGKTKYHIVERLMGKMQVTGHKGKKHKISSGHLTGKGVHTYNLLIKTFELIEKDTKQNPIQVFVKALENASPREEITAIEYGGARYPQAVDCAPQRRLDLAMRQISQAAYSKSFDSKKKIHQALAEEIIKAYKMDTTSQALAKKLELERQADSSR